MNPIVKLVACCCSLLLAAPAQAERADREQPLHLDAERVNIDDAKQISVFEGNVHLVQGTLRIDGDKVVVTDNGNGVRHGTTTGNLAHFRQKLDDSDEYADGYGERIEYDTQSEIVELFGRASMKRGLDEVHGDHITYNSQLSTFVGVGKTDPAAPHQGRVHAIFQPKDKSPVPAKPAEPLPMRPSTSLSPSNHE